MNKSTQKNNKYNPLAVNKVAEKYGFTPRYVRACLKGDYKGIMPDNLKKDYKERVKKIEETIEQVQNSKI